MATNRQIEIDVVLNSSQAEKGLDKIETSSKEVGESFSNAGKVIKSFGGESSRALGGVGEAFGGVVDSVQGLNSSLKAGGSSFTALLGPIGIAVVAVSELMSAFREYRNEVDGTNIRIEAYKAAASELTSIIEELSDAQVVLNEETIRAFRIQSQRAQRAIEESQAIREKSVNTEILIDGLRKEIEVLESQDRAYKNNQKSAVDYAYAVSAINTTLEQKKGELLKLEARLAEEQSKADKKAIEGAKERKKLTEDREAALKKSPEFLKKLAQTEAKLLNDARINELQKTKDDIQTQIEIARIGSLQKQEELRAIEDISEQTRSKAIAAERSRLEAEISAIEKAGREKRLSDQKRALAERQRQEQQEQSRQLLEDRKRLQIQQQLDSELRSIRALEIQSMEIHGADKLAIIEANYQEELKLAKENENLIEIARLRRRNAEDRFLQEEFAAQQEAEAQSRIFAIENAEFDLSFQRDSYDKELKLLELRYKKERELAGDNQEMLTELTRRETLERTQLQAKATQIQIEQLKKIGEQFLEAGASAAYASLVAGESFKDSVAQSIYAIGQQAAVQSALLFAESVGRLAFGDVAGAALKAKAGAMHAGVAAIAGVAANKMGVGGSGGGGGEEPTSPSGIAQTSAPQREEASQEAIVYNINFSGAVIYDTKTAAEQALADRVTQLQNRRRRGGVMRRSS